MRITGKLNYNVDIFIFIIDELSLRLDKLFMRNILLVILYILGFICASLLISQIPALIKGDAFFINGEEMILSLIAGTASGLIVGFFNIRRFEHYE
jgi:hypothetical protein